MGFGRKVKEAIDRRGQSLADMSYATRLPDGSVRAPRDILQRLERTETVRVGRAMAAERGLTFIEAKPGEYVSGRLAGAANLASGRFAMLDNGLGFQLVPWQPVLNRIGRHIGCHVRRGWDRVELRQKARAWSVDSKSAYTRGACAGGRLRLEVESTGRSSRLH
ncbi:DUF3363 domain-containing protein [Chelativorans sp. AA-79]|uniref:DUF3363 domain-containing protein n=1 Tax=Chelativorans sp. AA-79 TaxID=3028735 RepID=UPI0023F79A58|nr:DUF3363 domain-containing protein [Chelativorans sp. AA-79]WEX09138.1 DUF3363 domain-containing protein [Chelativorans sp. AA-79]